MASLNPTGEEILIWATCVNIIHQMELLRKSLLGSYGIIPIYSIAFTTVISVVGDMTMIGHLQIGLIVITEWLALFPSYELEQISLYANQTKHNIENVLKQIYSKRTQWLFMAVKWKELRRRNHLHLGSCLQFKSYCFTLRLILGDQEVLVINDNQDDDQLVFPPQLTIAKTTDIWWVSNISSSIIQLVRSQINVEYRDKSYLTEENWCHWPLYSWRVSKPGKIDMCGDRKEKWFKLSLKICCIPCEENKLYKSRQLLNL